MRLRIIVPVLAVAAALPATADQTASEDIANDLEIAMPASALFTTLLMRDWQGLKQFGYGFGSTWATVYAIKTAFPKERPDRRDDDAFPSGHTAITFHTAAHLHRRYGWRWAVPAYAAAAWVGHSRIYADRHHVEDVVAGAALGIAAAYLFTTERDGLAVAPDFGDGYVGLSVTFRH